MDDKNPNIIGKSPGALQRALQLLRDDFDAHNHDGANSRAFQTLSAETVSARTMLIRKTSYTDTTNGFWSGLVGNVLKWYLGDGTNYIKWDGSSLVITGTITGGTISGATISGSTITGGSLNINNNFIIDSNGNATAIGLSSLNYKAYTNFEASGRFISSVGGTGSNSFGNQGCTMSPGATGTSYARLLWWITNYVYLNNPTFTCSLLALTLNAATGSGGAFVGLGNPSVSGGGYVFNDTHPCAGFFIQKSNPDVNVYAVQQLGDSSHFSQSALLTTLADNDTIELFIRFTSTGVQYYFRKGNGSLSAATTLPASSMPSSIVSDTYIQFSISNTASAVSWQLQLQAAAYEH